MFTNKVRAALVLLCFTIAAYQAYAGRGSWVLTLCGGLLLIYEYFSGGTTYLAFKAFRSNKTDRVKKYLNEIHKPEWLRPSAKSYYYFLLGITKMHERKLSEAKDSLLVSIKYPFRTEHMKCYAYIVLSNIHLDLGENEEGLKFFNLANATPQRGPLDSLIYALRMRIENLQT